MHRLVTEVVRMLLSWLSLTLFWPLLPLDLSDLLYFRPQRLKEIELV
jgi:hypothetical protein